jgi:hypothetical protein
VSSRFLISTVLSVKEIASTLPSVAPPRLPVGGTAEKPIHRYRFPPQESGIRRGEEL